MGVCSFCGEEKGKRFRFHEIYCNCNPNRKSGSNQYIKASNLGLEKPKLSVETREKLSKASSKQMTDFYKDTKNRELWSEKMQKAVRDHPESYSKNNVSGRVKLYSIKDTKVKGKWELLVAEKLDELDIQWTNSLTGIEYEWGGRTRKYFPDFYLKDYNLYIEVKGYKTDRDIAKWTVVDNLVVLEDEEIKKIKNGVSILEVIGVSANG